MVSEGSAYYCYSSKEEIAEFKQNNSVSGNKNGFKSPWREKQNNLKKNEPYVIRLKTPEIGETSIDDTVKGKVSWSNENIDDLILVRSDGSPTYMLAVVVDDHDMKISNIIRGDDHLTNTAKQTLIYKALGWKTPQFSHISLIHGSDGSKLSKRHGALGIIEYRKLGYPAEAMRNHLARLGWSYGDAEYFSTEEAIKWFNIKSLGKSPSRFDHKKLDSVSKYHLKSMNKIFLLNQVKEFAKYTGRKDFTKNQLTMLESSIDMLKERAKNYLEIIENARFFIIERPIRIEPELVNLISQEKIKLIVRLTSLLSNASWSHKVLASTLNEFVSSNNIKFIDVAQPLRIILTGQKNAPELAYLLFVLGKAEALDRISDFIGNS